MDNKEYAEVLEQNGLTVESELIGYDKAPFDDEKQLLPRPHWKITVKGNGSAFTFDFWGSIMDYCKLNKIYKAGHTEGQMKEMIRCLFPFKKVYNYDIQIRDKKLNFHYQTLKKDMTDDSCFDGFNCILSDALSGDQTFNEFCDEFGYDNDRISHQKIYFACQESLNKLRKVFSGDLYDLANSLER